MRTIYIAETVYSELGKDDKFHVRSRIKAFDLFEDAKAYADYEVESFKGFANLRLKFVTVHSVEEVL